MASHLPNVPPSAPGYEFSSADVARAKVPDRDVARFILQRVQRGEVDATVLLASLLRTVKRANAQYVPLPFGLDDYQIQQIDGGNPMRNFLLIQNVGSGDLMVVFEPANPVIEDFSAAGAQDVLNMKQKQAVRIVAGGNFFPDTVPINPITIFTLGTATEGVVIVGS